MTVKKGVETLENPGLFNANDSELILYDIIIHPARCQIAQCKQIGAEKRALIRLLYVYSCTTVE